MYVKSFTCFPYCRSITVANSCSNQMLGFAAGEERVFYYSVGLTRFFSRKQSIFDDMAQIIRRETTGYIRLGKRLVVGTLPKKYMAKSQYFPVRHIDAYQNKCSDRSPEV